MLWVFKLLPLCILCILWQILSYYEFINVDTYVISRSHTKITEDTKKNMNIFKRPFFVPLCLCVKN